MVKNSLGVVITRPDSKLIVMRGIPGGGKSTKAKTLVGEGVIHSTDALIEAQGDYRAFFEEMIQSKSFANLSRMHSLCLKNAKKSMDEGVSPVVIDNTNIKANEPKAYVKYALESGYKDENILIVDVADGGLTAEALAVRNTHGVPVDKIAKMIKSHNSVEPLTVDKIMAAKDMYSDVLYSAVVLDEESHKRIVNYFKSEVPAGWSVIAHHMTIAFGKPAKAEDVGKTVQLEVYEFGESDMAIAVKVRGYESKNEIPHITVAINPNGGKPVDSNKIEKWEPVFSFKVTGIVTNYEK